MLSYDQVTPTQIFQGSWWRHQMEAFSALLALCAGIHWSLVNSPQSPVIWSFKIFFDLRLNKGLRKQSWGCWFETPSCLLWRYCNDASVKLSIHFHISPNRTSLMAVLLVSPFLFFFSVYNCVPLLVLCSLCIFLHIFTFNFKLTLIARFMGQSWGPSGTDRTQVGPMLAPWTLLSVLLQYPNHPRVLCLVYTWNTEIWIVEKFEIAIHIWLVA